MKLVKKKKVFDLEADSAAQSYQWFQRRLMGKWANRLAIKSCSALHVFKHHSSTLAWVPSFSLCEAVAVATPLTL